MVGVALVARVVEGDLTDDVCGVCGSRSALAPRLAVFGSVSLRVRWDEGVRTLSERGLRCVSRPVGGSKQARTIVVTITMAEGAGQSQCSTVCMYVCKTNAARAMP